MDETTAKDHRKSPTILVIDDCAELAESITAWLQLRGFRVLQASDGNAGLAVCRNQNVDIVLADIVMPDKEGIGTIRELRKLYPTMGILAMSGAHPMYLDNALALGADGAISKPFRMDGLLHEINRILARQ